VRNTYTGIVYLANKSCQGSTLFIEGGGALLHYDATSPDKTVKRLLWVKNFPKIAAPSEAGESVAVAAPKASWTGSGFLMSEGGLVATNHHVAGPASSLRVLFPMAGKEFKAKLVLKDPNNDLAILQLEGFTLVELHQSAIPYGLARSRSVSLGDSVFTIGYPLSQVLGKNAKFSNGTISSKSGVGDDMVHLQINVPIQPGNSGSPLFDARGNIIGIIVASLNTDWMQQKFGVVPQNVNFAVKSDYLINLAEMLPDPFRLDQAKEKVSPDQIEPFICLISANP
jgi:serine protease Do